MPCLLCLLCCAVLCRRLLCGYSVGHVHVCVASCLCFIGAFLGLLPAAIHNAQVLAATTKGATYSYVGLMQYCCVALGALLPPLTYLLLLHAYRSGGGQG